VVKKKKIKFLLQKSNCYGIIITVSTQLTVRCLKMNIQINNSSNDPIYLQIKNQIKSQIISGDLQVGDKLPSIRFMAKELRISMITAKRAFDELEAEGFIDSVQGKGNFVARQNKELIREEYLKKIEERIQDIIEFSDIIGLSNSEIMQMIKSFLEGSYE
jgi:transcriptional regulator, GntR family